MDTGSGGGLGLVVVHGVQGAQGGGSTPVFSTVNVAIAVIRCNTEKNMDNHRGNDDIDNDGKGNSRVMSGRPLPLERSTSTMPKLGPYIHWWCLT